MWLLGLSGMVFEEQVQPIKGWEKRKIKHTMILSRDSSNFLLVTYFTESTILRACLVVVIGRWSYVLSRNW